MANSPWLRTLFAIYYIFCSFSLFYPPEENVRILSKFILEKSEIPVPWEWIFFFLARDLWHLCPRTRGTKTETANSTTESVLSAPVLRSTGRTELFFLVFFFLAIWGSGAMGWRGQKVQASSFNINYEDVMYSVVTVITSTILHISELLKETS